jgi:hypothetical protein
LFPISCLHCAGHSLHNSDDIFVHLQHFLKNEWKRKCEDTGSEKNVPRQWEEEQHKPRPDFLK